jgi:hypothetical protein
LLPAVWQAAIQRIHGVHSWNVSATAQRIRGIISATNEDRTDAPRKTTATARCGEPASTLNLNNMFYHTTNGRRKGSSLDLMLGCLLFVVTLRCEAQNLVPNASMEEHSECPVAIGFQGFSKPLHWEKWMSSPEYFHECAGSLGGLDTLIGVPQNGWGYQYAYHGQAYIGMIIFGMFGFREYVGCELLQPLIPGTTYYLSFWTNVAGGIGAGGTHGITRHASNNVGMLFTMEHNIWQGNNGPPFALRNYAHLHSEEIIADPDEWVQVSGSFVADSAYAYLVLGNFFSNELQTLSDSSW